MRKTIISLSLLITASTYSRELNIRERSSISNLSNAMNVLNYSLPKINKSKLSIKDYLSYTVLKNSCNAVNSKVKEIQDSLDEEELKNQSKALARYMNFCSQGVISLTSMFIRYSEINKRD